MRIVAPLPVFATSGRLRRDPDRARRGDYRYQLQQRGVFRRTEIRYAGYFPAQRHAEAVLARYGSFNRMPHYAFRPGRFRAGRAHQCHVGNRGRPRRSDRTDSGIITEGKWHNRRVADPAFFIDQIRPLAGFSGMSALSFVIGDPVATDFFRDVAHEFEARDQGVDVGLGNDEILVVAGLYIGIL